MSRNGQRINFENSKTRTRAKVDDFYSTTEKKIVWLCSNVSQKIVERHRQAKVASPLFILCCIFPKFRDVICSDLYFLIWTTNMAWRITGHKLQSPCVSSKLSCFLLSLLFVFQPFNSNDHYELTTRYHFSSYRFYSYTFFLILLFFSFRLCCIANLLSSWGIQSVAIVFAFRSDCPSKCLKIKPL